MLAELQQGGSTTPAAPSIEDIISLAELADLVEGIYYEQLMSSQQRAPIPPIATGDLH